MADSTTNHPQNQSEQDLTELELTDADILDAMQRIPGYLDISTADFRTIYHLAHRHALDRLLGGIQAGDLMRTRITPLRTDMTLDVAAQMLAQSGFKGLPVVDANNCVVGMLTESDFLRRLHADTFLALLLHMLEEDFEFKHRCHETRVAEAMSSPVVTVDSQDGFREIIAAFHLHAGRSLPVVDDNQQLLGLLLRKDFLAAYHMEDLL